VTTDPTTLTLGETAPPLRDLLADTWRRRELLVVLAKQEFLVRYRRATFGVLWAAALPILQAGVLAFVLSKVVRFGGGGDPYALFVYIGVVPATYFSTVLSIGSTSIVDGAGLTTKIYFPRLLLPLVTTLSNLFGMVVNAALLLVTWGVFGRHRSVAVLLLPVAIVALILLSSGLATLLSAIHVYGRDVRFIVQAGLVPLFYMTPIFFPLSLIGGAASNVLLLNPLTGVVELFRVCLGVADPRWQTAVVITVVWIVGTWAAALFMHRRHDRLFVDLL
jgi:lipopolysaccharide transport system permease protein